ncbi:putative MFS family arabinose efflux permease [Peribacillus deserti]|uniref:MFS family arabinose efflux permease n=1 Tax=Peribacillus deserti TaxID=673318 RepID=A0ABS2QL67_9BACI|nr:MFS transporter [Peribacillus deserti]MBM7693852.1 putative MFS family arabinose efflux permease [Peribacillus deserti]
MHKKSAGRKKVRAIYWIIGGITFLTLLVAAGVRSAPGVLIIPLEEEFGWNRAEVTFPLSVNLALYGLCGPFAAALMNRYGIRKVILTALFLLVAGTGLSPLMTETWQYTVLWGVTVGIGSGLTSSVLGAVVANKWFKEKKGLVVGLFTASGAAGQLVFLPLFAKLVTTFNWTLVTMVNACTAFIIFLLVAIFMKNDPKDAGVLPYGADESEEQIQSPAENPFKAVLGGLKTGIRSKDFWLLAGSFFVCGLSTNGLIGTHLIPACMEMGIPEVTAAGMLAFMGIFDILGTTISGWLSDRWDSRKLLLWYYGLRGLSLLFLPYALESSGIALGIFVVFYGLDWVATVPPTVKLCNDAFGKNSNVVYGWVFAAHQLGAAAAAFGGGLLFTMFGTYTVIFMSAGILCGAAAGFVTQIQKTNNTPLKNIA